MAQDEFEKEYECYEADLKKNKGRTPWESGEIVSKDSQTRLQADDNQR